VSKPQAINWRTIVFATRAPGWSLLVRLLVGLVVFFPEGIQKLAFPEILGAGRFANIGIPYPEFMGPFVGAVETICGALIVLGLCTRLAAIPLIFIMIVAIASTKVPILLGHDFWMFHLPKLPCYGFWSMLHELRHAAWIDLSADRGRGSVVAGRAAQPSSFAPIKLKRAPRHAPSTHSPSGHGGHARERNIGGGHYRSGDRGRARLARTRR
jgi:uncharacterized membrane protein YphA (DoxX/SURF4 family)